MYFVYIGVLNAALKMLAYCISLYGWVSISSTEGLIIALRAQAKSLKFQLL